MVFWGGAVATGAAAVLFAKGSDFAMALFFKARTWATWWPYVSAPVGLGLCAWLTRRAFVGAEGSGIPCGIFAPSLASGAGLGAHIHSWLPLAPTGAMVILSIAAYFSGVVQAPLTALVIVTEMTGNRSLTLLLMAVVLIGRGASALICRRSLYQSLADRFMPTQLAVSDES